MWIIVLWENPTKCDDSIKLGECKSGNKKLKTIYFRYQVLTGQIKQLEREGERNIADLKEAREKIRELQNQLIDSQHETEKAREEEKKMKEEFEKWEIDI